MAADGDWDAEIPAAQPMLLVDLPATHEQQVVQANKRVKVSTMVDETMNELKANQRKLMNELIMANDATMTRIMRDLLEETREAMKECAEACKNGPRGEDRGNFRQFSETFGGGGEDKYHVAGGRTQRCRLT